MIAWVLPAAIVVTLLLLASALTGVTVYPWQTVLVYAGGRYERALGPGRHRLFRLFSCSACSSARSLCAF